MASAKTVAFVMVKHGGSPLSSQIRLSSRGVKGVLSMWCLSALLLFGSFADQLVARAWSWCFLLPHACCAPCC